MAGPTVAVAFGIPVSTVDRLIQAVHESKPGIHRWVVFSTDVNALGALDDIWRGQVEVNAVMMPAIDETMVPCIEDILVAENLDMAGCIVIGCGLDPLRETALQKAWGYVEGASLAPDELIARFLESIAG
jgi:hypothetical protein